MPETTEPLTEAQIEIIAARKTHSYGSMVSLPVAERDALIRDWRALRAANKALAADNVTMTGQVQKYRDEVDSLRNQQWTAARVIQWLDDALPKPANTAFTAGNERQIAYRVERLREQLAQLTSERDEAQKQLAEAEKVLKGCGWERRTPSAQEE